MSNGRRITLATITLGIVLENDDLKDIVSVTKKRRIATVIKQNSFFKSPEKLGKTLEQDIKSSAFNFSSDRDRKISRDTAPHIDNYRTAYTVQAMRPALHELYNPTDSYRACHINLLNYNEN